MSGRAVSKSHLDTDDGRTEYEIEFYKGHTEYDYDIDAKSGAILSADKETDNIIVKPSKKKTKKNTKKITKEKALDIALKDAGIKKEDTTYSKVEKDYDDGQTKYDVEFHVGQKEYNYDIRIKDGKILEHEAEIDD